MNPKVIRFAVAVAIGAVTATVQGFAGAEWVGASLSGVIFGSLIGWLYSLFKPTDISKWALGIAIVSLLAEFVP